MGTLSLLFAAGELGELGVLRGGLVFIPLWLTISSIMAAWST